MKRKKKTKLELAQNKTQAAINKTNETIEKLGMHTNSMYETLTTIQDLFDKIRNIPSDRKLQYEELKKIRLNWKEQAEKIEKDYQIATVKNASAGAAGAGLGIAVVTIGPTVAMGVATTFGVASTGTAISTLSGAAATNAALAWLGGGALAVGGGGMVAGETFLALAGPIGWAIAGVSLVVSGLLFWRSSSDKKHVKCSMLVGIIYSLLLLIGIGLTVIIFEIKGIENNTMPAIKIGGLLLLTIFIATIGLVLENKQIKNGDMISYKINKASIICLFICVIIYGLMCFI